MPTSHQEWPLFLLQTSGQGGCDPDPGLQMGGARRWSRPDPWGQEAVTELSPLQASAQPPCGPLSCQPAGFAGCLRPPPAQQKRAMSLSPHWGAWGTRSLQLACSLPASSGAFPGASLSEEAAETEGLHVGGAAFMTGLQENGGGGQARPGSGSRSPPTPGTRVRRWQVEGKFRADLETPPPRAQVPGVTQGVVPGAALGPGWNLTEVEWALGKGGSYGPDRFLLGLSC